MKTHLSDITERLRNELDLTFRHTQLPLLSLILLLFAAAPVFAQDMDEDEETEMEEIETEETEEEAETEESENEEDSGEAVSDEQSGQTETPAPAAEERTHCVLVLLPFTSSYAEHVYVTNAISKHIASFDDSYLVMQKEFDMLNASQEELQSRFDSLKPLLDSGDVSAVVGIGQELLPLLSRNADQIPAKTGLILFTERKPLDNEFAKHENTCGVILDNPVEKTLDLIFHVFPDTKRILPLAGRTETGKRFIDSVKEALAQSHPDTECLIIDNNTVDTPEMIRRVCQSGKEKDSVVLFHSWYGLNAVNMASLSFFLQRLCLNPDVPVFAVHDSMFAFSVAGGTACPTEASVDKLIALLDDCVKHNVSAGGKWETVEARRVITASSFQRFGISNQTNVDNLMIKMDSQSLFRRENARTLVAVTFSAVLILALLAYIAVWDHYRRRLLKLLRAVFKQIPSRIVVGSRNGIAHFIHVGKFGEDSGVVRFPVNELPEYADETFRHAWEEVFATGETQKFQMATGSRHRSVEMALFENKEIFGRDTAFWISHDVEELLQAQNELQAGLASQKKLNDLFAASLKLLSADATAVDMTNDVLSFIVRSVKEHMKADFCCIMRYNYEKNGMELFVDEASDGLTINENKRFIPFPAQKDDKVMARLEKHLPVVINDFAASLFLKPDAPEQTGSKRPKKCSMCFSPIFIDGNLWGHLASIHMKGKYDFSDLYQQFLQGTAHVVEAMLEYRFIHSRLERGEYEKQLIMENLPLPLILLDRNLNLIQRNSAAKKDHLLGFPDALHDNLCHTVFCKAKNPPEDCPVRGVLADFKPHVKALAFNGKDYLVNAYPIMIGGELANILLAWFDVTAENENQRKLEAALREAKDASKAKSLFLASMSHELRTPLNAVIGFCELLQNSALSRESQLEYLKSISVAGHTLLDLISNILDTCKLETEQVELQNEKTDVRKIVTDMVSMFKSLAEKKQLAQPLVVPDDLPYVVLDRMRLRQVLVNLLGNAFKFTDKGYVGIKVTCKILEQGKCRLEIAIRDSGIGIAPDKEEKIFEPFVQQDAVRDTHVYKGSGLGLAICDRYIKAMGGRIDLDSDIGKGSVFTIVFERIPYIIPTEEERAAEKNGSPAGEQMPANTFGGAATPQKPTPKVDLPGFNALIVDDVPINLKVLGAMLKGFHINLVQANSGADALAKLPDARPDLVLTDMWMPGMSGEELARNIRNTPNGDKIVIMAVTADVENQNNFDMSVFDGILLKPVTKVSLAFAFQEMLDKGRIVPKD
ncbi:MAG: response regulator [Lentisphaeria bacterium]|nr:response regulator [Lentisphaeria bacterium]